MKCLPGVPNVVRRPRSMEVLPGGLAYMDMFPRDGLYARDPIEPGFRAACPGQEDGR